jgi:nicotinate-nucleotide adenylyltransferase
MSRVGVFGGSFNPPHLGHLRAAQAFMDALALERVHILPAGEPPLKAGLPGAAPQDRLRLCQLTFAHDARFWIDDLELRRPGVSYTVESLQELQRKHPGHSWFLLIGTDQLEKFTQWKDWRKILQLCTLCVLQRDAAPLTLPPELPPGRVRRIEGFTPLAVSATQIRASLAAGVDASAWLAPQALHYIKEKGLYGSDPDAHAGA